MRRILLIAVLVAAACSKEQPIAPLAPSPTPKSSLPAPPSAATARDAIAHAPELSDFQFTKASWSTVTRGSRMNERTRRQAKELVKTGWLGFDGAGDLMLTNKSRSDKRFLLRANGLLDVVPLAKKELGDVTAVRANPDGTATADFTFRWIPNEVGASFKTGEVHDRFAGTQSATATLVYNGKEWEVVSIQ
jgi:hypothetical protein